MGVDLGSKVSAESSVKLDDYLRSDASNGDKKAAVDEWVSMLHADGNKPHSAEEHAYGVMSDKLGNGEALSNDDIGHGRQGATIDQSVDNFRHVAGR